MARELYFENILALLIAVEHEKSPEIAFRIMDKLMETGRLIMPRNRLTEDDMKDIHILKEKGMKWDEIAKIYAYKNPSYLCEKYNEWIGR